MGKFVNGLRWIENVSKMYKSEVFYLVGRYEMAKKWGFANEKETRPFIR